MRAAAITESALRLEAIGAMVDGDKLLGPRYQNLGGKSGAYIVDGEPVWVVSPLQFFGDDWPDPIDFRWWCRGQARLLRQHLGQVYSRFDPPPTPDLTPEPAYVRAGLACSPVCGHCTDHDYEVEVGK